MYVYDLLKYIGLYAPIILFFLTLILLRNKVNFLQFFVAGFILNNILNILLKLLFKHPRPSNDIKTLEIAVNNGVRIGFDKFGMPSGHAQNCGFCLTFIFLTLHNPFYTFLYHFITIVSLFQRYLFHNHSILQLFIGLIIGSLVGYSTYFLANKFIVGNITLKNDDDAPI
jgi:membrane-associated phospholipid phosphatase